MDIEDKVDRLERIIVAWSCFAHGKMGKHLILGGANEGNREVGKGLKMVEWNVGKEKWCAWFFVCFEVGMEKR